MTCRQHRETASSNTFICSSCWRPGNPPAQSRFAPAHRCRHRFGYSGFLHTSPKIGPKSREVCSLATGQIAGGRCTFSEFERGRIAGGGDTSAGCSTIPDPKEEADCRSDVGTLGIGKVTERNEKLVQSLRREFVVFVPAASVVEEPVRLAIVSLEIRSKTPRSCPRFHGRGSEAVRWASRGARGISLLGRHRF